MVLALSNQEQSSSLFADLWAVHIAKKKAIDPLACGEWLPR